MAERGVPQAQPATATAGEPGQRSAERRARLAVAAIFLTNGALFAGLLPRYPQIKDSLDLSNAALGTAIAAFPLGALLAGLAAGALVSRFRSSRVAVVGTVLMAVAVLLAGVAPTWGAFAIAMLLAGAMDAVVDVAQNAHGLRVQRLYGRSILNSFHAVWSVGAVLGGLLGAGAVGLDVPVLAHLVGSAVVFSLIALGAYACLLPGAEADGRAVQPAASSTGAPATSGKVGGEGTAGRTRGASRPVLGVLLALGVIAAAGAVVEDAGASWGAIYLTGTLAAVPAVGGLAFVALQGMQFVGRLTGDRLVDRFGQRAVARAGAATTTVGMGVALLAPTTALTLVGFGAAGLGVATLVPAAMHAADELPGLSPGTGLTAVSWMLRVGFLVSPPVVGAVADAVSLRVGLLVVPLAGITVLVLSAHLASRLADSG